MVLLRILACMHICTNRCNVSPTHDVTDQIKPKPRPTFIFIPDLLRLLWWIYIYAFRTYQLAYALRWVVVFSMVWLILEGEISRFPLFLDNVLLCVLVCIQYIWQSMYECCCSKMMYDNCVSDCILVTYPS